MKTHSGKNEEGVKRVETWIFHLNKGFITLNFRILSLNQCNIQYVMKVRTVIFMFFFLSSLVLMRTKYHCSFFFLGSGIRI